MERIGWMDNEDVLRKASIECCASETPLDGSGSRFEIMMPYCTKSQQEERRVSQQD